MRRLTELVQQAIDLSDAGEYARAIALLADVIRSNSSNAQAYAEELKAAIDEQERERRN